jgi:alkylation response protein AidB-like acyl-CoA dehydrogenase
MPDGPSSLSRPDSPACLAAHICRDALLAKLAIESAGMQARAHALDAAACFPAHDIEILHATGALQAPLPVERGGLGLGTEPDAADCLASVLQVLGYDHLAVARLYEAHVNAVRLLTLCGSPTQQARAAHDIAVGHLIGLWVTDPPNDALRASSQGILRGGKAFCSGAGHVARALVTCRQPDGTSRLAYLPTEGAIALPLPASLQGLRAAVTGMVTFNNIPIGADDWLGHPGDYLRQPHFSAGAWRTSAATAGCLARLVDLAIQHLSGRNRTGDPHQQARIGRIWIARETARLWTNVAASAAEGTEPAPLDDIVATVNFARIAIETASMEALALVERSLGLQAFLVGTDIERVRRDLATYLRQPAPDETLTEAASHIITTRIRAT